MNDKDGVTATCKGNRGNLMQHWVLCELIAVLQREFGADAHLHYVDAYSMAPFSELGPTNSTRDQFEQAKSRLPGKKTSYELEWHRLNGDNSCYPSSAVFVASLWKGPLSMHLFENDEGNFRLIKEWLEGPKQKSRIKEPKVINEDWRKKFVKEMNGAARSAVCMIQFDPYLLRPNDDNTTNIGSMNLYDLRHVFYCAKKKAQQPIVVQLSSYGGARVTGSVQRVDETVSEAFSQNGFNRLWSIHGDDSMISLVFYKGFEFTVSDVDKNASGRFKGWLSGIDQP